MKCQICGKDIPEKGYAGSRLCLECYKQSEKSALRREDTVEESRRRQQHFGSISLNEDMPVKGYGNLSD